MNLDGGRIEVWECAASDEDGRTRFWYQRKRCTAGRLESVLDGTTATANLIEVETRTLDSAVAQGLPVPDLVKIDVEGGGMQVLRGARGVIRRAWPSVYIELHNEQEALAVKVELSDQGYCVETLSGKRIRDPLAERASPLWCYRDRPNANRP